MPIKVNRVGVSHAKSLIAQGKVDRDSPWSFSAEDGNKILGDNNWGEYKKWFLAIDDEANEETKEHYKFPYGKNGKVYRQGVIAAKKRAAQQGYTEIVKVADELLQLIDKDEEKSIDTAEYRDQPPINTAFRRTFPLEVRGILDDENRIVEGSFSSEAPIERWFGPEILLHSKKAVDFRPFKEAGSVLINHDPNQRVGRPIKVWLDEETKKGRLIFQFGTTQRALEAYQEVKDGILRGVSVGYVVLEWMRLRENEEWNGFKGPAWIAVRWQVFEVSLTPVPADVSVGVGRTKEYNKKKEDREMPEIKEQEVDIEGVRKEAIELERQRIKGIKRLCERFGLADLADELIDKGTSVNEARKIILDKLAEMPENKPVGQVYDVEAGIDEREKVRTAAVDGLMIRAGLSQLDDQKDKVAPGARDFANLTLLELAKECLKRANIPYFGLSKMDIVGRAFTHTSSDFPIILQNVAHKALMAGFTAEPETWQKWCDTGSVSDFKIHTMVRIGEFDDLDEVPEGGEYKHAQKIMEQQEQYSIAKYGKLFSITRETIINDDLNAISVIPKNMGEAAKRKIADLAYQVLTDNPLMGDGNPLFCSAHNNLASSGSAPTYNALKTAIKAMMKQKDIGGKRRLHIRPQFIIVPIEYVMDVEELLNQQYIDMQAADGKVTGKPNVLRKYNLTIVADGRLDDAGNAWYLAGPKGKTVTLFFLDGQQAPTLESQKGWTVDGVEYKVRIECGAKALTWKALYKNPGA